MRTSAVLFPLLLGTGSLFAGACTEAVNDASERLVSAKMAAPEALPRALDAEPPQAVDLDKSANAARTANADATQNLGVSVGPVRPDAPPAHKNLDATSEPTHAAAPGREPLTPSPKVLSPTTEAEDPSSEQRAVNVSDERLAVNVPAERLPLNDGEMRVYAKTRNVWIRGKPTNRTQWIGFLWYGDSVRVRDPKPVSGPGCKTWYAVEPRGYVCATGDRATVDPNDPVLKGIFPFSPNPGLATPHPFYGESVDAQRYLRLPSVRHQRAREWDYRFRAKHIETFRNSGERHKSLLGIDLDPGPTVPVLLPELPRTLQLPHKRLIPRSTVAWTREIQHEGRTFVLADDLTWVPKDRIKPYQKVTYRGLHIGEDVAFPLALFRDKHNPKFTREQDGSFTETDATYPRLGWTRLTGKQERKGRIVYHETLDGHWVSSKRAVVPTLREKTPWGTPLFEQDPEGKEPRGRGTWVDVSIMRGWLVAYEGTKPVFVTLMSPGRGGPPQGKKPPIETASTPTGRFKITGKFVTSTMIAPNNLVHSAVPWAQNFSGPHALHGAYWHNDWGKLKSGGCVNVSPEDGKWLFDFTEPRVPEGWHGVRWLPKKEAATTFLVRR